MRLMINFLSVDSETVKFVMFQSDFPHKLNMFVQKNAATHSFFFLLNGSYPCLFGIDFSLFCLKPSKHTHGIVLLNSTVEHMKSLKLELHHVEQQSYA